MLEHAFRTKPLHVIVAEDNSQELKRQLSLFDLIMVAIGATVGSGIFVTTGSLISKTAGPAAVISWIIAGLVCILNAFSFMELSTRVPSSGSTYSFAYHTLGELPAVIGAALLTLEYAIAGAGVARSWAMKMETWLSGGDPQLNTKYHWLNNDNVNIMAACIEALCVAIVLKGVRFGKYFINAVTTVKIGVVLFIIIAGLAVLQPSNLKPFVPTRDEERGEFGVQGVISGASLAFWGYGGFDEVCCLAAEAKNPKKAMPVAVIGGLVGTMFLSVMSSFVLSGMTPYVDATNFSAGFNAQHVAWAAQLVRAGEILTMPIVVLICFMAQPRLEYALASDGLMPRIFAKVNKSGTLFTSTLINGIFFTLVALVVPFATLWDIVSFGVMMSFIMCNSALISARTRKTSPQTAPMALGGIILGSLVAMYAYKFGYSKHSSVFALVVAIIFLIVALGSCVFMAIKCPQDVNADDYSAPLIPFLPTVAILADFYLMSQIKPMSQFWGVMWVVLASLFYFAYGYKHSEGRTGWLSRLQPGNTLLQGMLSTEEPSPSVLPEKKVTQT